MPIIRLVATVVLLVCAAGHPAKAQSLTFSLFERYVEALRLQAGIPGLSASISENGRLMWEHGFGHQDLQASLPARPDTPYPIADLSQTLGAALVLQCVERGHFELQDQVQRWSPGIPDRLATFVDLLAHRSVAGTYRYDMTRFGGLTEAIEECFDRPYVKVLADEILDRLGMADSVPGGDVLAPGSPAQDVFPDEQNARFSAVLRRMAVGYHVDQALKPSNTDYPLPGVDAGMGVVSTVRDLARFESALDAAVLIRRETLETARTRIAGAPRGPGWFVQDVGGESVVWQFGIIKGAYSSMLIKVPRKGLTLILLANSDGLSAPFPLGDGDVSVSPFARIFLRLIG